MAQYTALVKSVETNTKIAGCLSIELNRPPPEEDNPNGYETWRYISFDPKGGPSPIAGQTIQCSPYKSQGRFWWIREFRVVEANAGPQQAGALVQPHVNGATRPNGAARPAASNSQACEIFVTGTIGRFLANQKDWPTQRELTGMVTNARDSFENGMNAVPEDEKPSGHAANNEEPDWPNL